MKEQVLVRESSASLLTSEYFCHLGRVLSLYFVLNARAEQCKTNFQADAKLANPRGMSIQRITSNSPILP